MFDSLSVSKLLDLDFGYIRDVSTGRYIEFICCFWTRWRQWTCVMKKSYICLRGIFRCVIHSTPIFVYYSFCSVRRVLSKKPHPIWCARKNNYRVLIVMAMSNGYKRSMSIDRHIRPRGNESSTELADSINTIWRYSVTHWAFFDRLMFQQRQHWNVQCRRRIVTRMYIPMCNVALGTVL